MTLIIQAEDEQLKQLFENFISMSRNVDQLLDRIYRFNDTHGEAMIESNKSGVIIVKVNYK